MNIVSIEPTPTAAVGARKGKHKRNSKLCQICYIIDNLPTKPLNNAQIGVLFYSLMKYNKPPLTFDEPTTETLTIPPNEEDVLEKSVSGEPAAETVAIPSNEEDVLDESVSTEPTTETAAIPS